jgi:AcrR family transcriptional regulator
MGTAKKSLDRQAWIEGAFNLLGEKGEVGVRVEPLAKRLGVTKGSFYWHFRDRRALLDAVLIHWESRETTRFIELVEAGGGGPADRLKALFGAVLSNESGLGAELAVRDWARRDRKTSDIVLAVDNRRGAYIEERFGEMGLNADEARARASLLYGLVVGEFMIWRRETTRQREARINQALAYVIG